MSILSRFSALSLCERWAVALIALFLSTLVMDGLGVSHYLFMALWTVVVAGVIAMILVFLLAVILLLTIR